MFNLCHQYWRNNVHSDNSGIQLPSHVLCVFALPEHCPDAFLSLVVILWQWMLQLPLQVLLCQSLWKFRFWILMDRQQQRKLAIPPLLTKVLIPGPLILKDAWSTNEGNDFSIISKYEFTNLFYATYLLYNELLVKCIRWKCVLGTNLFETSIKMDLKFKNFIHNSQSFRKNRKNINV